MDRAGRAARTKTAFICMLLFLTLPILAQGQGEKLFGTWVNTFGGYHYYKLEITSEGMINYMKGSDQPYSEARYTIDKEWTDESGNTYLRCTTRWSWIPFDESKVFDRMSFFFRIDATGNKVKEVHSGIRMPSDFESGRVSDYKRQ